MTRQNVERIVADQQGQIYMTETYLLSDFQRELQEGSLSQ